MDPMIEKSHRRKGTYFTCPHCHDEFYRRPSHVRRGIKKTCGKTECLSKSQMGSGNSFWGKNHSPETLTKIQSMRRARVSESPRRGRGPVGYKHTPEARARISASLREQWRKNRDKRLAATKKGGETQRMNSLSTEPRYRLQFTPMQRRDWIESKCVWCDATEDLVLDHILPVMAGGKNARSNCQTLCRTCNLWKMRYVDRPLVISIIESSGAELQP